NAQSMSEKSIIKIALVDDQKLFRSGLKMIIQRVDHFEVAFEAANGLQFFERLAFEPVDLVILDVEMPELDGTATLIRIKKEQPDLKVIMLTMHESERLINHLMQAGANGFLLKDEDPKVVVEAIEQVMDQGVYFRHYVSQALLQNGRRQQSSTEVDQLLKAKISDRELQVLRLICNEMTSQEIADQLFISVRTVDGHRRSLQDKTGARNIAGLVMYAVNNGLV
ncbi:MAG: response regulator transcription factor, partial [Bacteroidota bacterium]